MFSKLIPVLVLSLAFSSSVVQGLPNRRFRVRGQSSISTDSKGGSKNDGKGNNQSNNQADSNNPQTSDTLDPSVINLASNTDGQQNITEAGQTPSTKSSNNFINFCIDKGALTNGTQIKNGSCNPIPMGQIASVNKVPSTKFQDPANLSTLKANQNFTIKMAVQNMGMGFFTNPDTTYFAAPAVLNQQGQYVGHSHVTVEKVDSLASTKLTDPSTFAFFKGLNAPLDKDGTISTVVAGGLPSGVYRLSSITTSQNHQCLNGPVAQRGSIDDAVYFTVTDDGQPDTSGAATGDNNKTQNTKSSSSKDQADTSDKSQDSSSSKNQNATSSSSKDQSDTTDQNQDSSSSKNQNTTSSSSKDQSDTTDKSQDSSSSKDQNTTSSSSKDQSDTTDKSQDSSSSKDQKTTSGSSKDQSNTTDKSQDSSSSKDQAGTTNKSQDSNSNSNDQSDDDSCSV